MASLLLNLLYFINSSSEIRLSGGGSVIFSADQSLIFVKSADAKFKIGSLNCRRILLLKYGLLLKSFAAQGLDMLCVISDLSDEDILWMGT